jgi:acetylglutamate kinase
MTDASTTLPHEKARILAEALPNMRRHSGETFVIKYGGHALSGSAEGNGLASFAADIVALKQVGINPVVVHGGGPQIGAMLARLNIETRFIDGVRVTDAAAMQVVQMVLRGLINSEIVAAINQAGGNALGLSGVDANLIRVEKLTLNGQDMGLVGQPRHVRGIVLKELAEANFIPVVAPLGVDAAGTVHNINADTAAGAIAAAVGARRLLLLTDVPGVLDATKTLIPQMSEADTRALIADGTISGGMIPKVQTCLDAVAQGVGGAVILDGRVDHALLLELFTEGGAGTLIGGGVRG